MVPYKVSVIIIVLRNNRWRKFLVFINILCIQKINTYYL